MPSVAAISGQWAVSAARAPTVGQEAASLGYLTLVAGMLALPAVLLASRTLRKVGVYNHTTLTLAKVGVGLVATFYVMGTMQDDA